MSSLATFFASLYDRASTLPVQQSSSRFGRKEDNKMWRQIGSKNVSEMGWCERCCAGGLLFYSTANTKDNEFSHSICELSIQPCKRVYSSAGKLYDVALYCVHGKFYAINATCPHLGGPLDVIVDLEELMETPVPHAMCPWHLFAYNLTNGCSPQGPKVDTHAVKVQNGYVFVLHETELSLHPYETDI